MANEKFGSDPAVGHYIVVPSDDTDLPQWPRALYVDEAGDAVLADSYGVEVTYTLAAGQVLPLRPRRVKATGTTATLIAWY